MRNQIILKKFLETKPMDLKILMGYCKRLEEQGWTPNIMEGGYFSPDGSTIFITNRDPYYGELLQAARLKQAEYIALAEKLIEAGDFVRY